MEQVIQKLKDSNIRVVSGTEITHPSEIIDLMSTYGDIKMAKLSGKIDGLDDDLNEIQLINNYLIEVDVLNKGDFYGTIGVIVQQGSNEMKVYSGLTAHACINLSVFSADYVKSVKSIDLDLLRNLLDKAVKYLPEQIELILDKIERLKTNVYNRSEWTHKKGQLLETMNPSLFSYLTNAEKLFRDEDSLYYDQPLTDWTLLSAMTDKIKDEGISARLNKTLQLEELFV